MDLSGVRAKYESAAERYGQFRTAVRMNNDSVTAEAVIRTVEEFMAARSELVRDVCAAIAQAVIEREALRFMAGDEAVRAEAQAMLAERPEVYLRVLTRDVVRAIHDAQVGTQLRVIVDGL